jgi:predicted transcriptional regulator
MITRLKLKGNELLVFALIHGFSQDGESRFKGSLKYLIEWTGLDKTTVIKILKSLVEKQYINKFEYEKNKVRYCEPPRLENPTPPVGKSNPILDNDIDNSIDTDKDKPANPVVGDLFPEQQQDLEKDKKRTSIFRNSDVYKLVKFGADGVNDYSEFEKLFATPEFEKVDLIYYFHTVADWSETKQGVKRTRTGWIATVRNFIRGDIEKKKLHLKPEYQAPQKRLNVAGAMEFLNNDY